jgi:hypothetical protein
MKLWVNICFYYVEDRVEKFKEIFKTLSEIPNIKIIINSNVNFDDSLPIEVTELSDTYHYTWEHKRYMPEFLNSEYTHFVYLEGNIEVTKKTFNYWLLTRELFKRNNLNYIPATHRVQKDKNGNIYSLDCTHTQRNRPTITVEEQKFISLSEPYQGMFIMDKELVREHIQSDYYNVGQKGSFGIRESANLGNMFINIPSGYNHRCMIPVDNFSDSWVTHFGTDYHGDPGSPHAKIKVEDLF